MSIFYSFISIYIPLAVFRRPYIIKFAMSEVQKHGFLWEKDIIQNVYGITEEELSQIKYTSKMDLPGELNRLDGVSLSIKTTCSANTVCMADCIRIYDAVNSNIPFHMTVVQYKQNEEKTIKKLVKITEVNLSNSRDILFGSVTREQIVELCNTIKTIPQKRSPTHEEHAAIYAIRNQISSQLGAIHLDIKCNSTQSRLQCSFNQFQKFIEDNPDRVIAQSDNGDFRGGKVMEEVISGPRSFCKKE